MRMYDKLNTTTRPDILMSAIEDLQQQVEISNAAYDKLHHLIKAVRSEGLVSAATFTENLGKREQVMQAALQQQGNIVAQTLTNSGGIRYIERPIAEGPEAGGIMISVLALAVIDFDAFHELPQPIQEETPANDDQEEEVSRDTGSRANGTGA